MVDSYLVMQKDSSSIVSNFIVMPVDKPRNATPTAQLQWVDSSVLLRLRVNYHRLLWRIRVSKLATHSSHIYKSLCTSLWK
jgi:hypothetical protein